MSGELPKAGEIETTEQMRWQINKLLAFGAVIAVFMAVRHFW
jgi:hypothetical protein